MKLLIYFGTLLAINNGMQAAEHDRTQRVMVHASKQEIADPSNDLQEIRAETVNNSEELRRLRMQIAALEISQRKTYQWLQWGACAVSAIAVAGFIWHRKHEVDIEKIQKSNRLRKPMEIPYFNNSLTELQNWLLDMVGVILSGTVTKEEAKQIIDNHELRDNLAFLQLKERVLYLERTTLPRNQS